MKSRFLLPLFLLLPNGCAPSFRVLPVEAPPATVRFDHGSPTSSITGRFGGVQVTPLRDRPGGKLAFAVAAFNDGGGSANFGTENLEVLSDENRSLQVFTVADLEREARQQAVAASVAIAILGAAAAAASQAAATQTFHSSYSTPYGVYRYKATYYDAGAAAAGTAASVGMASAGIWSVQQSLDRTIAGIGNSVLQTTTVDPGESVGGRVFVRRPRSGRLPQQLTMLVHWQGEDYPFHFAMVKDDGSTAATRVAAPSEPVAETPSAGLAESGPPPLRTTAGEALPTTTLPDPDNLYPPSW